VVENQVSRLDTAGGLPTSAKCLSTFNCSLTILLQLWFTREPPVLGFTSTPQSVGNRTQEAREDGDLRIWTYDPTNQLISERRTEGESWSALTADQWGGMGVNDWGLLPALSAAGPITTYVYDPVGNRLILNVDGELTTSTYNAANRLVTAEDISGITTYTFDANGNQRTVETPANEITTYSWTYENQLAQLEEPDDVITTYVYAPTNRRGEELRLVKETETGIINYIWDDQNLIQEVDDTSNIEAEYTLNPQAYGNLISQRRDGDSTFYHYDALGSTQSLTDQTGTVENEYTYSAFGQELSSSGSVDNPFTWVGELGYYKEEDGRYTLRRREYDDAIARFLSEDPARFDEENLYPYVRNNPTSLVDPSGLEPELMFCDACTSSRVNDRPYNVSVYRPSSLEESIVDALGPDHGPKFLMYQGTAAAQKVVNLYAHKWKFSLGGVSFNYSSYAIDPPSARVYAFSQIIIPGGRTDCIGAKSGTIGELDLYANLAKAVEDPRASPYYRGEPMESASAAYISSFACSPFMRASFGASEAAGGLGMGMAGAGMLLAGGPLTVPILLIGVGVYGFIRGSDSFVSATVEVGTGKPVRELSSQTLDLYTGDKEVTDTIFFVLDATTIVVGLAHGAAQIFKKTKIKARDLGPRPKEDLSSGGEFVDDSLYFDAGGWSRVPKTIQDRLALEAARKGAGEVIITDLKDARFLGMEKWEYAVKSNGKLDSVVHYVFDPKTGMRMDFKFKKHSCD